MNQLENRRRRFFANPLHRDMFFIIFLASILPAFITGIGLFYLIFYITAEEIAIPKAIAYNIIPAARKVTTVILIMTPLVVLGILTLAYQITHKMIGPFDRIVNELDQRIKKTKSGPIHIRKNDKFSPLVDKINQLLEGK